ncbi:hypothetical protein NQ318_023202, partial [Aromia moschata]
MNGLTDDFVQIDEKLQDKLNEYTSKQTIVIDITDDEGDKVDDIINSIKEHLETKKFISSSILNNLNESEINEEIFVALTDLNSEQVFNFGNSLQTTRINNEVIISYYIRYLLVKKLTSEYSEQLQTILCEFSAKYSNIICESFKENYIAILDVIINTQVEYNTLNKLVDIFSNCTSRFTINKYFG